MSYQCFKEDCKNKVQYICLCLSSETFSCKFHFKKHLKISNITHIFDSVLSELCKWTKDGILKFLIKEKLNKKKVKNIALDYFTNNIDLDESSIKNNLEGFDCDLKEIDDLIIKTNQSSKEEEILLLNSLALPPDFDAEKLEETFLNDSESNVKLFCRLGQLRNKKFAILNRVNNDVKTEQDFRKTCELYKNDANHWLLRQAYEEYINAYQKITSLYHIEINSEGINLFKYDIENEEEYVKILDDPYLKTAITPFTIQLPNSELFILNEGYEKRRFSLIIDKNYGVRKLAPVGVGLFKLGIYFNRNVYCYGWKNIGIYEKSYYFMRYDLDKNIWKRLSAPKYKDYYNMIIFNGNILTASVKKHILLYSIDIESFSKIYYKKKEKIDWNDRESNILMNSEERLYLIEYSGWIYESEAKNEYNWKKISFSGIDFTDHYNFYFSYNNERIYFSLIDSDSKNNLRRYFKFDLYRKEVIEIACYDDDWALKIVDGRLKVIENYRENIKLDSDEINNGYTLYHIFKALKWLLNCDPKGYYSLKNKGNSYRKIGWNNEAIKCYNKIIEIDSKNVDAYISKGKSLEKLGKNIEALECYETAISLKPSACLFIYYKGLCLYNLGRIEEATVCFNKLAKFENNYHYIYFLKGVYLYEMGKNYEAIKYFNKAIDCDFISLKFFLYRACVLNDLGEEEEAMQDFDKAYYLMMINNRDRNGKLMYNLLKLLKGLSKLLDSAKEFKKIHKKLINSSPKSPNLLKETKEKELIMKVQNSKLIKRAREYLDLDKCKPIEEIEQLNKTVLEHRREIVDIVTQLSLSLQDVEHSEISNNQEYDQIYYEDYTEILSDEEYSENSNE